MAEMNTTGLTKVFVGGLAWQTPSEVLRDHFLRFGDIVEAVVIHDKLTGRSKGYGFVTFKEAEAAKKACQDPAPIINGRRANCNLAAAGARTTKTLPPPPATSLLPHPGPNFNNAGSAVGGKPVAAAAPHAAQGQWYFPVAAPPSSLPSPFRHQHPQAPPYYGYFPTYSAADFNNVSWNGGGYYPQMYRGATPMHATRGAAANTHTLMMPFYYQQHHAMGLQAHMYPPPPYGPTYKPTSPNHIDNN